MRLQSVSQSPTVTELKSCKMRGDPRTLSSLALSAVISQVNVEPPAVREECLITNREQTEKAFAKILVHLLTELQATKLQLRSDQTMEK